jgi:hypothetical protein
MSKPNLMPYNLCMENQTIAKPLGFIRDFKIFVHGIPYMVTFNNNNVLDYNYAMLLKCPWLRDVKVSHDWGINIITIQGTSTIRTIHVINKLGVQTKRPKILNCYDFHCRIYDDEEDVMFAMELDMFSIGTITIPTHIEPIPTTYFIPNIVIAKLVLKHVKYVGVLAVKLTYHLRLSNNTYLKLYFIQRLER